MSVLRQGLVTAAALGLVRLILRVHPREFRERFSADILNDVAEDIRSATSPSPFANLRAAVTAVIDAIRALRAPSGHRLEITLKEKRHMRTWIQDAAHDVRLGLRGFSRERAFSASVIVTLALGIGVNAAMFGVVDRLLLRGPEHVRDFDRVRRMQIALQPAGMDVQRSGWFGYATYDVLRRQGQSFDAVAAYSVMEDGAILGRGIDARRVNRGEATASLFPLLGVQAALGRFYTEQEDDTGAPAPVVVIGYGLWQTEFGGRRDAIGQSITIDNAPHTVVGIAPKGFTGPDLTRVDVWVPESLVGRRVGAQNWTRTWNGSWLSVVVRLRPDVSDDRADAEATAIFRSAYAGSDPAKKAATLAVRPLLYARDGSQSMESRVSAWLFAVAGIVLLISCANVVNLMLAHGIRRRREFAVRLALGAARGRLVRLLVAEALTLAVAGGVAGLVVAYGTGLLMRAWLIPSVEWPSSPVNVRVLLVATVVSITAGLVVGLFPALRASAPNVSSSLKAGVRDGGGRRSRARTVLTVVQAALCALLLVGSGLFVVSLGRVRAMDLGLQPDRVLTVSVQRAGIGAIPDEAERQRERDRRAAFYPMVVERLRQRADVEAASLTIGLPFASGFGDDIRVPGRDTIPKLKGGGPYLSAVTGDYFKTVGTRIVRGRAFTAADRAGSAPVAIVNETMAGTIWPNEEAIGKCFYIAQFPACAEVVGISANTRHFKLQEDESMAFYIPFGQEQNIGGTQLLVRPRGGARAVLSAVRQELVALDPTITFVNAAILQDRVDPQVRPWRLGATMFTLMGLLSLIVAAVGLYSVMAYFVTHRAHEIGVRMALGARPADVARLVVRGGLGLAAGGTIVGLGLALLSARFVEPLLFHTSPRDPGVFAGAAATLMTMAVLATVMPAARAGRVNPVEAMRVE
jgi:putative ABC transport system permease protein